MKVVLGLRPVAQRVALTIGNFDGVHSGHRHLLSNLVAIGSQLDLKVAVMTFWPHPLALIKPKLRPDQIDCLAQKTRKLQAVGVDYMQLVRFRKSIAAISAEDFIQLLAARLNVKYLVVGGNFRFGADRRGDIDMLKSADKFEVNIVEDYSIKQTKVSSKMIRSVIAEGKFDQAEQLLCEPYQIYGRVVTGDKLGRSLGVPTANLAINYPIPLAGVYAAVSVLEDGTEVPSALSVGTKSTVGGSKVVVEAHLLDFNQNLYGSRLQVKPRSFLRAQQKFANLAQLQAAMDADLAACRREFGLA